MVVMSIRSFDSKASQRTTLEKLKLRRPNYFCGHQYKDPRNSEEADVFAARPLQFECDAKT